MQNTNTDPTDIPVESMNTQELRTVLLRAAGALMHDHPAAVVLHNDTLMVRLDELP